ncbi:hypothetical protein N0V85_000219 [Neurospora sp. IMI 360204]|nr:hypothetical protein N0V85_000219 [Neurospora sp. IMI 360204]
MIPTTSSISTILLYLVVQARQVRADPNAPCYFPGGEFAPGYFACQAFNAPVSSCCPAGWTCFSNALCIATTESNSFPNLTLGAVQRGACTNPQWNNNICGSACLDNENRKGELAACGNDRFCCAGDFNEGKCDCSSNNKDSGAFTISAGLAQTIIQVSDTTFTGSPSLSIASTRATGTKASTTGSITQTTGGPSSTSLTSSPKSTSGQTSSSAPTTTPAAPPAASSKGDDDSDSSGSSSSGNGLKIGLGVGIPVAVLAVAGALAYFLWWKPRQIERARRISQHDHYFQSTDLAENDPHGPAKYEPYRQAAT